MSTCCGLDGKVAHRLLYANIWSLMVALFGKVVEPLEHCPNLVGPLRHSLEGYTRFWFQPYLCFLMGHHNVTVVLYHTLGPLLPRSLWRLILIAYLAQSRITWGKKSQ